MFIFYCIIYNNMESKKIKIKKTHIQCDYILLGAMSEIKQGQTISQAVNERGVRFDDQNNSFRDEIRDDCEWTLPS